jgi:hypothetical protein
MARIFQGSSTRQVDGHTSKPAQTSGWYWEPEDYEGDVLWSEAYPTREEAAEAATE